MLARWFSDLKNLAEGAWSNLRAGNDDAAATPAQQMTDASTNKHVDDYLAYYVALPHPPKYAVQLAARGVLGKRI
jgi:hypothetical protein